MREREREMQGVEEEETGDVGAGGVHSLLRTRHRDFEFLEECLGGVLSQENAMEYFRRSPFYDRDCVTEAVKRGRVSLERAKLSGLSHSASLTWMHVRTHTYTCMGVHVCMELGVPSLLCLCGWCLRVLCLVV